MTVKEHSITFTFISIDFSSTEISKSRIEYNICVGKNICQRPKANQTWMVKISGVTSHLYLSDIKKKIFFPDLELRF